MSQSMNKTTTDVLNGLKDRSFIPFLPYVRTSKHGYITAYMDAWEQYHKTACTSLPEDEHLDI